MRLKTLTSWGNIWRATLLVVLFAIGIGVVHGQPAFNREHEPVVVSGSQLSEFIGFPVTYIHVYAYHAGSGEWELVPSQIDEKEDSSPYSYFVDHPGLFSTWDELVFMAKDRGDQVPDDTVWPDNRESKQYVRYEITATDTVGTGQAWVYVYLSSGLGGEPSPYVEYNAENDIVSAYSYTVTHNPETASGLPTSISIPTAIGGDDLDFLDRWRLRINIYASAKFDGITLTIPDFLVKERMNNVTIIDLFGYDLKISVFQKRSPDYISGPIRVLRNMHFGIRLEGSVLENPKESEFVLQSSYYRTFADFPPYPQEIPEIPPISDGEIRVTKFFIGAAHNSKVYGLRYYSPDPTYPDLPIDDDHGTEYNRNTLMNWPGTTWYGLTVVDPNQPNRLSSATVLTLIQMHGQALVEDYSRYFTAYDNVDESRRYGIMGLKLETDSGSIQGTLDVLMRSFYFGENFSHQQMAEFAAKYGAPLQVDTTSSKYFDETSPARITDLAVIAVDDTSATLTWTAVGDDSMSGGAASAYMMRYSEQPMDWNTQWVWWAAATQVTNMPEPGEPGTQDSVTVRGLEKNITYYFVIRARDAVSNWSELSTDADGTTTPVELVSFLASASRGQVELSWTTASETNNFGFEVQHRLETETEWRVLGFVEGAGTTNEPQSYSFIDNVDGYGRNFYRLKQVDTDGAFQFSHVIDITVETPRRFALYQNYPNPFSTQGSYSGNAQTKISFEVPANYSGLIELKVYDVLGREVRTLIKKRLQPGYHKVGWDGRDAFDRQVVSGVYVYVLSSDRFREVRKMVIMR